MNRIQTQCLEQFKDCLGRPSIIVRVLRIDLLTFEVQNTLEKMFQIVLYELDNSYLWVMAKEKAYDNALTYRIHANRKPISIRTPGDTFWTH